MSWPRILARYTWAIALREWVRCGRVKAEVRLGTTAAAGAPADANPPHLRALMKHPEYSWQPGPADIPGWLNTWSRLAQLLAWQIPPKDLATVMRPETADHS